MRRDRTYVRRALGATRRPGALRRPRLRAAQGPEAGGRTLRRGARLLRRVLLDQAGRRPDRAGAPDRADAGARLAQRPRRVRPGGPDRAAPEPRLLLREPDARWRRGLEPRPPSVGALTP